MPTTITGINLTTTNLTGSITLPTSPSSPAENTLDCYRENTWTPSRSGGSGTYTTLNGTYTRIGNRVFFTIQVTGTGMAGTGGNPTFTLPFAAASGTTGVSSASCYTGTVANVATIDPGSTVVAVAVSFSSSTTIIISGHYVAA